MPARCYHCVSAPPGPIPRGCVCGRPKSQSQFFKMLSLCAQLPNHVYSSRGTLNPRLTSTEHIRIRPHPNTSVAQAQHGAGGGPLQRLVRAVKRELRGCAHCCLRARRDDARAHRRRECSEISQRLRPKYLAAMGVLFALDARRRGMVRGAAHTGREGARLQQRVRRMCPKRANHHLDGAAFLHRRSHELSFDLRGSRRLFALRRCAAAPCRPTSSLAAALPLRPLRD
jgi:hypothetical protein